MSEYIFIADFFVDHYKGGAEFVNEELIKILASKGHTVEKIRCQDTTAEYILQNRDKNFILSNFMRLPKAAKDEIRKVNFALYEHDHKYIINRNPAEYPNLVAPKDFLINQELFEDAHAVFCQSSIHKKALEANLNVKNVINLGSSLWSEEFLNKISEIPIKKTKKAAIIEDSNPIKQQTLAEKFCNNNDLEYDLISADSPLELAEKLSSYEFFVFLPEFLETFSRVAVEAKMVGCKLYTNRLLGAASEPWFTEDREKIINEMRNAREKTYNAVVNSFKNVKKIEKPPSDITVILNAYRRPYNLEDQIQAIRSQDVPPREIWLWVNDHEDNHGYPFEELGVDRIFKNDHNWKFYGRFAAALLADTKFVAIFDDDTVPGSKWFSNCLKTHSTHPGILGSAGVILKDSKYYMKHDRCGWPTHNSNVTPVDLVGHAWFFERDWLQYLWKEKPFTWDNGEDIQFSYLAQKYGGINTYCPPHPPNDLTMHGSIRGNELGIDDKATSNNNETSHQQFFHERDLCVQNAIENGWKTILGL